MRGAIAIRTSGGRSLFSDPPVFRPSRQSTPAKINRALPALDATVSRLVPAGRKQLMPLSSSHSNPAPAQLPQTKRTRSSKKHPQFLFRLEPTSTLYFLQLKRILIEPMLRLETKNTPARRTPVAQALLPVAVGRDAALRDRGAYRAVEQSSQPQPGAAVLHGFLEIVRYRVTFCVAGIVESYLQRIARALVELFGGISGGAVRHV